MTTIDRKSLPPNFILTKLRPPQIMRVTQIQRDRLFDMLKTGQSYRLTLVTAPAGFGKTTLVSSWLHTSDHHYGWFSVDKNDNVIQRFIIYLIEALRRAGVDIGENLALDAPLETIVAVLTADIIEFSKPLFLILDDVHYLQEDMCYRLLQMLIDYQPENLHFVFIGRSVPPLTLARLRGRNQMIEINITDLQFSEEESNFFLNTVLSLDLSDVELNRLYVFTEGWATGLRLASLALQSSKTDKHRFITQFSGTDRHIADYLFDEVFSHQADEIQQFLLHTAILGRFTSDLCDAVRLKKDSSSHIEYIERMNLFLLALDNQRRWYRYHHLFAEFLQHKLQQQDEIFAQELHQRASEWYVINDNADEAICHSLQAGKAVRAAELVEYFSSVARREGQGAIIQRWLDQLPSEIIKQRPKLVLIRAWLMRGLGDWKKTMAAK